MKSSEKSSSLFDYLFPVLFSIAYYISILIWLKLDATLPHWDMGRHLYLTFVYKELWARVPDNITHLGSVFLNYYYYPPLVHNIGLLFQSVFGFKADVAVASNIVWILTLSLSLYFLSKRLFNRSAAVISLLFVFASPIMVGQLREFQVDLPMTAVFSLGLFLLYKTENFSKRKESVWFGLIVGLGMLTKWTYAFFILPAALLFLVLGLVDKKTDKKQIIKNICLAIFFALLICGGWYIRNRHQLLIDFSQNGIKQASIEGDPYGFNWPAFSWYLKGLASHYLFLPLYIIAVVGIILSLIRKNWIPAVLFLAYYIIISALPNKDIRYIMPEIVLLSLVGASIIQTIKGRIWKLTFTTAMILIFLSNNALVAFAKYLPLKNKDIKLGKSPYLIIIAEDGYTSNSPKSEVCPMEQIISSIPINGSAALVGRNDIDFTNTAIGYFLEKEGRVWAGRSDEDIANAQYLIDRERENLPPIRFNGVNEIFLVKSYRCMDGSSIGIYKNRGE